MKNNVSVGITTDPWFPEVKLDFVLKLLDIDVEYVE